MSEKMTFKRPDGKETSGYYAEPGSGGHAPGIVVIQEWWGLNDQIKAVADYLVGEGYRALVPDLYRGEVSVDEAEAAHQMDNLDFADAATQDVRGAVQQLKLDSPKVAVIGFCMGGALSILSAVHVPEADAVACWYGAPPEEAADVRTIRVPLQGHFGTQDEFFPPSQVEAMEKQLKEGNVNYEFYWYDAKHGFGNETLESADPQKLPKLTGNYDPDAAKLAWQRTLDFFAKHIKQ